MTLWSSLSMFIFILYFFIYLFTCSLFNNAEIIICCIVPSGRTFYWNRKNVESSDYGLICCIMITSECSKRVNSSFQQHICQRNTVCLLSVINMYPSPSNEFISHETNFIVIVPLQAAFIFTAGTKFICMSIISSLNNLITNLCILFFICFMKDSLAPNDISTS